MMIIDNKFEIGQIVYLKTCKEQTERIITAICVKSFGYILYLLSCGAQEIEISSEKNVLITTTN